jgi:hypothetical protein
MTRRFAVPHAALAWAVLVATGAAFAQTPERVNSEDADEYTRYELLEPGSAKFRILYEVTATTPGATVFYNVIRKGSRATREAVFDRATGAALPFEVVDGKRAREDGLADAEAETSYIRVRLRRPVPQPGEQRLLIDKTYEDAASYFMEGERLVFARSLAIKRNAVVLPAGYELVGCNVPAQVLSEADGRIAVSFENPYPAAAALRIEARRLP